MTQGCEDTSRCTLRAPSGGGSAVRSEMGSVVSIQRRALVLNQNYEPLNVCSVKRAFVLVFGGKAELLEAGDEPIHGVEGVAFTMPSVIRLHHFVSRPMPRPRLTRREIFTRDRERCQYCGK